MVNGVSAHLRWRRRVALAMIASLAVAAGCSSDEGGATASATTLESTDSPASGQRRHHDADDVIGGRRYGRGRVAAAADGAGPATAEFLAGRGAPLVVVLESARRLAGGPTTPDDSAIALTSLSAGPAPDTLAGLATSAPDLVLAEGFARLVTATDDLLARCPGAGPDVTTFAVRAARGDTG